CADPLILNLPPHNDRARQQLVEWTLTCAVHIGPYAAVLPQQRPPQQIGSKLPHSIGGDELRSPVPKNNQIPEVGLGWFLTPPPQYPLWVVDFPCVVYVPHLVRLRATTPSPL